MDSITRNRIAKMVQEARTVLENETQEILEGIYGIHKDGTSEEISALPQIREDNRAIKAREGFLYFIKNEVSQGLTKSEAAKKLVLELSFTHLNRIVAFRLMEDEKRKVIHKTVSQGVNSNEFKFYLSDHPEEEKLWRSGGADEAYIHFLLHLCGLISEEIKVLFDPEHLSTHVFPRPQVLKQVLDLINSEEISYIWSEDETIGWIYQYFTPKETRANVRAESSAPRNSYEMAIRNQLYTPRYVVNFLADNTLGRTWYEMRKGDTSISEYCQYMVRRPNEIFLNEGETGSDKKGESAELFYIQYRPKKDPREILILDPACGSGHFLLYSFDLLQIIYQEAYDDPELGSRLKADFPDKEEFIKEIPRLILENNLHVIDIDLRATQIATLALWLKAQRTWQEMGIKREMRPKIRNANIACAEPMPGNEEFFEDFVSTLNPALLKDLVKDVWKKMKLAGEAGSLLQIEIELKDSIDKAKKIWLKREPVQLTLDGKPVPQQMRLDISGIKDEEFFKEAEERVFSALRDYADKVREKNHGYGRKLFAEESIRGFHFIEVLQKRFDVVLMNPPFGAFTKDSTKYCYTKYPNSSYDIAYAFVERGFSLLNSNGFVGCITTRTGFFIPSSEEWRSKILDNGKRMFVCADLGYGVLDAVVETAAYVISANKSNPKSIFLNLLETEEKGSTLHRMISCPDGNYYIVDTLGFEGIPGAPFSYWSPISFLRSLAKCKNLEPNYGFVKRGVATGDNEIFLRLFWEVLPKDIGPHLNWIWYVNGGEYSPYYIETQLLIEWSNDGYSLRNFTDNQGGLRSRPQNLEFFFKPGLSYATRTTSGFATRVMPCQVGFDQSANPIIIKDGCIIDKMAMLSFLMTRPVLAFVELSVGSGDTSQSGTAARNYTNGLVGRIPIPMFSVNDLSKLSTIGSQLVKLRRQLSTVDETATEFVCPRFSFHRFNTVRESLTRYIQENIYRITEMLELSYKADNISIEAYNFDEDSRNFLDSFIGPHPYSYSNINTSSSRNTNPIRVTTKKCYWADREIEVKAHELQKNPKDIGENDSFIHEKVIKELAEECCNILSYFIGCIMGRWDIRMALNKSLIPKLTDPFDPLPVCSPGMLLSPDGYPATSVTYSQRGMAEKACQCA